MATESRLHIRRAGDDLADRTAAAARKALGNDAYSLSLKDGAALELDEAVQLALTIQSGS